MANSEGTQGFGLRRQISNQLHDDRLRMARARDLVDEAYGLVRELNFYHANIPLVRTALNKAREGLDSNVKFLTDTSTDPESIYVHNLAASPRY